MMTSSEAHRREQASSDPSSSGQVSCDRDLFRINCCRIRLFNDVAMVTDFARTQRIF